jgi:catechol 2,3-dioxygenase-like lactoylglutathione lyase family enzyme
MILETTLTIMVSNLNKSVTFYTETLGLPLKEKYGSKYAELEANGFVIGLHLAESEQISNICYSKSMFIGFRVEDLESAVDSLQSKGVLFSTKVEEGVAGKFAYFEDPDGNPLYLWQSKASK